jgi:outer membrane receptor for ferrienterochelin and colicin
MKRFVILALFLTLVSLPAFAQIPTGTLSGHVTDGREALPGVTVTITSPAMQGTRTAVTNVSGDYIFTFLMPGDYHAKFELQGFQTIETTIKINAAQTQKLDATMPQAKQVEEVTVTGAYEKIQTQGTEATSVDHSTLYKLPVAKDINTIALLSAGVAASATAQNAAAINGAPSYENLFMVDGVNIEDNIRGTPTAGLYIEDAVQETTTSVSEISAEYGRFTGGVVNALTKSGGNDFHASIRDTLTSDKWTAVSPLQTASRSDTVNSSYEGTLGGFVVKDHLWFFLAGRKLSTNLTTQLDLTNIPVSTGQDEKRYEGKLTWAITPNHRLIGSYIKTDHTDLGYFFRVSGISAMDLASVYDRQTPRDLTAFNYTGVLTDNFFIEGQYSKKKFTFENSGSKYTDIARGTDIWDLWNFANIEAFNSPVFCAVCNNATIHRDNDEYLLKASLFLSSQGLGSHDIVLGVDRFEDKRLENNWQNGSGYLLLADGIVGYAPGFGAPTGAAPWLDANGSPYPVFVGGSFSSYIALAPILDITPGNNFRTDSAFVNDKWRLNNNFSFNIGLRYDKNHGENGVGHVVTKDSNISPRLGITYDPLGDGKWQFQASYAKYVAGINNGVADVSSGGTPGSLTYLYEGPDINVNCDPANPVATGCVTAQQAAVDVVGWFNSLTQDQQNALLVFARVPGYNEVVLGSLKSPNVDEYTIGASTKLGTKGAVRLDYVHRKWGDFYTEVINTSTGQSQPDPYGNVYDMTYLENTNSLKREYNGVDISAEYRLTDAIQLGGNYTWSTLKGNFDGETGGSGAVASLAQEYPEYNSYPQFNPSGYLTNDQRSRARVWGVWDLFNTKHNRLSVSLLESYASGTPYSASGTVNTSWMTNVTNPGYISPPATETYYFSARGAFRYDNITRTDLSFNYAFVIPTLGTDLQFFLEPRVTNLFNEHGVVHGNTTVYTARNKSYLTRFNPYTDTPTECPQGVTTAGCGNYQLGPSFGQPQTPTTAANTLGDYQLPRTFVVSLGVRF